MNIIILKSGKNKQLNRAREGYLSRQLGDEQCRQHSLTPTNVLIKIEMNILIIKCIYQLGKESKKELCFYLTPLLEHY